MFGGYGVWHDGQMFALFDKETRLYLKADGTNRAAFEEAGRQLFTPPLPAGRAPMTMPYYEAPTNVLDDAEALRNWARTSIDVAHAMPPKKPRARKGSPSK